jgi:hypothetical protein
MLSWRNSRAILRNRKKVPDQGQTDGRGVGFARVSQSDWPAVATFSVSISRFADWHALDIAAAKACSWVVQRCWHANIPLSAARRGLDVVSLSFPWLGLVHSWNLGRAPSRAGRTVIIENRMGRRILGFFGGHRRAGRNETLEDAEDPVCWLRLFCFTIDEERAS